MTPTPPPPADAGTYPRTVSEWMSEDGERWYITETRANRMFFARQGAEGQAVSALVGRVRDLEAALARVKAERDEASTEAGDAAEKLAAATKDLEEAKANPYKLLGVSERPAFMGFHVKADSSVPAGEIHVVSREGEVVGRITDIAQPPPPVPGMPSVEEVVDEYKRICVSGIERTEPIALLYQWLLSRLTASRPSRERVADRHDVARTIANAVHYLEFRARGDVWEEIPLGARQAYLRAADALIAAETPRDKQTT